MYVLLILKFLKLLKKGQSIQRFYSSWNGYFTIILLKCCNTNAVGPHAYSLSKPNDYDVYPIKENSAGHYTVLANIPLRETQADYNRYSARPFKKDAVSSNDDDTNRPNPQTLHL